MAGRNRPLSEYTIIADLMRAAKRHGSALDVQLPVPRKDTFTVASTPATTYTLSALPISPSINLSLNGLELVEGTDYTVNYATGVVTVSATLTGTPTPADVLTADYWTTGDLTAATLPADVGAVTDTFNRANSALHGTTTSDGNGTWTQVTSSGYATSDDINIVSNAVTVNVGGVNTRGDYLDASRSDGTCTATILSVYGTASFGGETWVFGRYDPATGNMIRARWIATSSTFILEEGNLGSGMFVVGTSATGTLAAGDLLSLVLSGTTATMQKNGTTVATGPLTHYTSTTTNWGLAIRDGGAGAVTIDTWTVTP